MRIALCNQWCAIRGQPDLYRLAIITNKRRYGQNTTHGSLIFGAFNSIFLLSKIFVDFDRAVCCEKRLYNSEKKTLQGTIGNGKRCLRFNRPALHTVDRKTGCIGGTPSNRGATSTDSNLVIACISYATALSGLLVHSMKDKRRVGNRKSIKTRDKKQLLSVERTFYIC